MDIQNLKIRMLPNLNLQENVSNWTSVRELKQMYITKTDLEMEPEDIRFFCLGKELQNDLFLYSYDVKDEMTI